MSSLRNRRFTRVSLVGVSVVLSLLILLVGVTSAREKRALIVSSNNFLAITVTVGSYPQSVGVNARTGYIYVPNEFDDSVTILRGTSVVTTVGVGNSPRSVGVNSVTGYAYVGNYLGNNVAILKGTSVVTTSPMIAQPNVIAVNPDTGYVYVGSRYFNQVTVFSATQVITTISLGNFGQSNYPFDIQIDNHTQEVYVMTSDAGAKLKVISGTQVIATVPVTVVGHIGVNPTTGYIYLTDANNGTMPGHAVVLSGTTVVANVPIGVNPLPIAVDLVRGYVYIGNSSDNTVSVISGTAVLGTVPVSDYPSAIGVEPYTGFAYVAHDLTDTVMVLSGTETITTLTGGYGSRSAVPNPATHMVYVADRSSNDVAVFAYLPYRTYLPSILK